MDDTLDFEESFKTDTSKADISKEMESDQDKVENQSTSPDEEMEEKSLEEEVKEEKPPVDPENKENEETESLPVVGNNQNSTEDVAEKGEPELDTIELTSNDFENDLLGADNLPKDAKSEKDKSEELPEDKEAAKVEEVPSKPVVKIPPPKIHHREFDHNEEPATRPKIKWECKLVQNLITTDLLKDLIDVKLQKEEEEADIPAASRTRRGKPQKSEPKKKIPKKEEEECLDFEPAESENESESEEDADSTRDPTAFPAAPLNPVPRSRKEHNRALLITNLIRPFTVLQLKTMLSHCGKVKSIWINTIKSRCYVVFASVKEATRARESLHGAVWPSTSPKTLGVDYAEDERMYSETDGELVGDNINIQVIEEQKRKKPRKDKGEKKEKPVNMLDELFKKTVAVPSIYWIPLSEEEAKVKEEERSKNKPRYFVPEPEQETEFVKPRAVRHWRTPDRNATDRHRDDRRRR